MNKRQIKKKYKKLCDKYNMPYSSCPTNRRNYTMCKEETKIVRKMYHNLKTIVCIHVKIGTINKNRRVYSPNIITPIKYCTYDVIIE